MNRSTTNPARARLCVESLESRELPSVNLAVLPPALPPAATARLHFLTTTPWQPGSTISVPTPRIIGILIAL